MHDLFELRLTLTVCHPGTLCPVCWLCGPQNRGLTSPHLSAPTSTHEDWAESHMIRQLLTKLSYNDPSL